MKKHVTLTRLAAIIVGVWLLGAMTAGADVKGAILKKDGGRLTGMVRWLPSSKVYVVTTEKGVALQVPVAQVSGIKVAPPANLEKAVRAVKSGQYGGAIPVLERIMKQYTMLEHDVSAARWLAVAYLKMKNAKKAVEMCEKVIKVNPGAVTAGELTGVYWDALLATGREATLKKQLAKAIESGNRTMAAIAQVKRGDIDMKNERYREALVDGYLRTAVLFQDVKEAQPDALYNAMKCFEELGQHSHAEKMRKKLLNEYPKHQNAQKARAGV